MHFAEEMVFYCFMHVPWIVAGSGQPTGPSTVAGPAVARPPTSSSAQGTAQTATTGTQPPQAGTSSQTRAPVVRPLPGPQATGG